MAATFKSARSDGCTLLLLPKHGILLMKFTTPTQSTVLLWVSDHRHRLSITTQHETAGILAQCCTQSSCCLSVNPTELLLHFSIISGIDHYCRKHFAQSWQLSCTLLDELALSGLILSPKSGRTSLLLNFFYLVLLSLKSYTYLYDFFYSQYYVLKQLKTKTYRCACEETGIQDVKCLCSTVECSSYSQEVSTNLLGQTEQMSVGILTLCITLIFITTRPDVYMFLGWRWILLMLISAIWKKKLRLWHPSSSVLSWGQRSLIAAMPPPRAQSLCYQSDSYTYGNLQPVSPATQSPKAHH